MKLLFAGDFCIQGDLSIKLSPDLQELFSDQDYCICNFEGAIPYKDSKGIPKFGPHLYNSLSALDTLKEMGFNVALLANNHIMDYGFESLRNTIDSIRHSNIQTVGAAESSQDCYKPLVLSNEDQAGNYEEIYLFNACQAEFGVCKTHEGKGGYAWINSEFIDRELINCRDDHRRVIFLAHAGLEEQIYPLPEWQTRYRQISTLGDCLVLGNHPHIVQGMEKYNDNSIYYSLGNFCFFENDVESCNQGMIVCIDTKENTEKVYITSCQDNRIAIDHRNSELCAERSEMLYKRDKLDEWANEIVGECWEQYYKKYYCMAANGPYEDSIYEKMKWVLRQVVKRSKFDETILLHNIQIETHRWCVERLLYNHYLKKI